MKNPVIKLAEPRMYTVKEAAAFFCMSRRWIHARIAAGDLQGFLCGNTLISGQSMNRYLASRAIGRPQPQPVTNNEPSARTAA